jgi:SET domain-containing protein
MCIFATRNIEPLEEICFSYNGTSVDDPDPSDESDSEDDHMNTSMKEGEGQNSRTGAVWVKCCCGVKGCKQIMFK